MTDLNLRLDEAAAYLHEISPLRPKIALVLGSGLGFLEDAMEETVAVDFPRIPHFKTSAVSGHAGRLVVGKLNGTPVFLFCGRIHLYEGHSLDDVTFAVRTAVRSGASLIVLTNAAGALHKSRQPGHVMMISDHINLQGCNVLSGPNEAKLGTRFPDMSDAYSASLRNVVRTWAASQSIHLDEGVYVGLLGPSYETPAEVRMLRTLGGDAVGMSTVQETLAVRHMGAAVLGFSVLTNLAAGVSDRPLSHDEVKETADAARPDIVRLLTGMLPALSKFLGF